MMFIIHSPTNESFGGNDPSENTIEKKTRHGGYHISTTMSQQNTGKIHHHCKSVPKLKESCDKGRQKGNTPWQEQLSDAAAYGESRKIFCDPAVFGGPT